MISRRHNTFFAAMTCAALFLLTGCLSAQAQGLSEELLKDLEGVGETQGQAYLGGIQKLARENAKHSGALKDAFLTGRQDWRVRVAAGALAAWADDSTVLANAFQRVQDIRRTRKAQPAEQPKPEQNEKAPPAGDIDVEAFNVEVEPLGVGQNTPFSSPAQENAWLRGLPTPIKGLTSHEARVALMVMLVSSPRPLPESKDSQWDEPTLAVAFRALIGLPPDELLDALVIDELKKAPLLVAHRRWAFEYVAARKLKAAVPVIRDSVKAWNQAEKASWPDRVASVLAEIGGKEAEDCLATWSKHEEVGFRQAAARGLAAIGTQRARVRLYYMSTSDPLDAMREYAKGLLKDLEEARKK